MSNDEKIKYSLKTQGLSDEDIALYIEETPDITKKVEAQKMLRTLKTEQATKSAGSVQEESEPHQRKVSRGVQRPKKNFFGR